MGFKKSAVVETVAPAAIEAAQVAQVNTEAKEANPAKYASHRSEDQKRAHGSVRMHGIIAGYKVAGLLAPTLANTAASIKDELKKLAHEIADDIEAYSFEGDQ